MAGQSTLLNPDIVSDPSTKLNPFTESDIHVPEKTALLNKLIQLLKSRLDDLGKEKSTLLNKQIETDVSSSAPVNPVDEDESSLLRPGVVFGEYKITEWLSRSGGEADLLIAEKNGHRYVIKYYRRINSIKPEVQEKLKTLNHPNLPVLFEAGTVGGKSYEIMEYYPKGSLEKSVMTEEELRKGLIPDMNEAIHELDKLGIVHRDIKPSNIAQKSDGHYVLMDFGISSVREAEKSIIYTKTGLTPEYSAPEVLHGHIVSTYADYYSLGVTIYKLVTGKLPYENLDYSEMASNSMLYRLKIPDYVSESFRTLMLGLTYPSIVDRKDKNNPNRRWGYDEVSRWLRGEKLPVPGEAFNEPVQTGREFEFGNVRCKTTEDIINAMARDWENGFKYLNRGYLEEHFQQEKNYKMASAIADLSNRINETEDKKRSRRDPMLAGLDELNEHRAYAGFLYANAEFEKIYCYGVSYTPDEVSDMMLAWLYGIDYSDMFRLGNVTDWKDHELDGFRKVWQVLYGSVGAYLEMKKEHAEFNYRVYEEVLNLVRDVENMVGNSDKPEKGVFGKLELYKKMFKIAFKITDRGAVLILPERLAKHGKAYYTSLKDIMDDYEQRLMNCEPEDVDAWIDYIFESLLEEDMRKDPSRLPLEPACLKFVARCWFMEQNYFKY